LARGVFSKLIEVGQGRADTRRTAVFKELVPSGVEDGVLTAVVDALAALGSAGREARVENAFNIDSDLDFYLLKALSEETAASVIEAMTNPNASIVTADDEEISGSLFQNAGDGFTYAKTIHTIYLQTYDPVGPDPITIYAVVNGDNSLRDLFDITTEPYMETGSPEIYMQNIQDIDWEEPIESFALPTATITIDGNATDWESVPVIHGKDCGWSRQRLLCLRPAS